jgi:hypothetical protein
MSKILATGYWLWSAFIAVAAGLIGSALNCEHGYSADGDPSWLRRWASGDHYVYPKAFWVGLAGVAFATGFVVLVFLGRRLLAALALVASLELLGYPIFAGTTPEERGLAVPALAFAVGALVALHMRPPPRRATR